MREDPTFVRYTMSEIVAMRARGEDETDSNAPVSDEDALDAKFWKNAKVVMPRYRTLPTDS